MSQIQDFVAQLSKLLPDCEIGYGIKTVMPFGEEYRVRIRTKEGIEEYYIIFKTATGWDWNCLYYT